LFDVALLAHFLDLTLYHFKGWKLGAVENCAPVDGL